MYIMMFNQFMVVFTIQCNPLLVLVSNLRRFIQQITLKMDS